MKINQVVKESPQLCPECGGPAFSDLLLAEKQDACYHKVRSRYKVWPSAYASGALVQCRKKGADNWGNKSKNEDIAEDQLDEISANPDYLRAAERSRSQAKDTQRQYWKSPEEKAAARHTELKRDAGIAGYTKRHKAAHPEMYPKVKAQPAPQLRDPSTEYSDDYSTWARGRRDTLEQSVAESSPEATFNALKGLKTWQVVIMNNYYRGKYSDYSGRYYYVLATSPEQARQVVLDNADDILKDLLSMKSVNGKKILPRGSAVRITADRIGDIKDGTEAGRMTTAGFKRMFGPQGPMMVKLSGGAIADVQGQEQGVAEGSDSNLRSQAAQWYQAMPGIMKKAGIDYKPVRQLNNDLYPVMGRIDVPGGKFQYFNVSVIPKDNGQGKILINLDVETSNSFYRNAQPKAVEEINAFGAKIAQALGGEQKDFKTGERRNHPGVGSIEAVAELPKEPAQWQNPLQGRYDPVARFMNQPGERARQSRVARSAYSDTFGGDASNYRTFEEQNVAEDHPVDSDGYTVDREDAGEYDYEGDQAKDQLQTIVAAARKLDGILDDNENMPEWVQMKITKATDYLDTAADYVAANKAQAEPMAEVKKKDPPEADYGDEYQAMVARVKKLAGTGPLKTVWDPQKRVYKTVPVAAQPQHKK